MTVWWTPGRLILAGAIGTASREDLAAALEALQQADGELLIDCARVTSIDPDGVAFLVGLARHASDQGARPRLIGPPRHVRAQIRHAGAQSLFES
jgi:ABC-type transporter Mla MlaB component